MDKGKKYIITGLIALFIIAVVFSTGNWIVAGVSEVEYDVRIECDHRGDHEYCEIIWEGNMYASQMHDEINCNANCEEFLKDIGQGSWWNSRIKDFKNDFNAKYNCLSSEWKNPEHPLASCEWVQHPIHSARIYCFIKRVCVEAECVEDENCGEVELVNNYCVGDEVWGNYSVPVCVEGSCEVDYEQEFNQTCEFGCEAGACLEEPPECETDEDCGDDYYSDNYCYEGNVYADFHDFSCECGTCVENITPELRAECEFGCEAGACLEEPEIECYDDGDCGQDGCISPNYCCDNNVCQEFIIFNCNNSGTTESYCSNETQTFILENCTAQGEVCDNGFCVEEPICEDTCESLGIECGWQMICTEETYCGSCGEGYECQYGICVVEEECEIDEECDDGLYCNGEETCAEGYCQSGTPIDCLSNNILPIGTCTNNPDNNPLTWDYFAGFTSTCDEEADECTAEIVNLTHNFIIGKCGVECLDDNDCEEDEICEDYECEDEDDDKDGKRGSTKPNIDYCGDGFCDEEIGENEFTCPEDCKVSFFKSLSYEPDLIEEEVIQLEGKPADDSLKILILIILMILILILLLAIIFSSRK